VLERPIKETGDVTVDVRLHPEVHAALKLTVSSKNPQPAAVEEGAEGEDRPRARRAPKRETEA
jgi:hypothetical protein